MLRSSLFPGLVGLLVPLEEERPGLDEGSHTVAHCTQPQHQPGEDNYLQYPPSPPPSTSPPPLGFLPWKADRPAVYRWSVLVSKKPPRWSWHLSYYSSFQPSTLRYRFSITSLMGSIWIVLQYWLVLDSQLVILQMILSLEQFFFSHHQDYYIL